jgi:hypothetical protein
VHLVSMHDKLMLFFLNGSLEFYSFFLLLNFRHGVMHMHLASTP